MERRPQPSKRVVSRPMPALSHAGEAYQRRQGPGVIELPDQYAGLDPDLRATHGQLLSFKAWCRYGLTVHDPCGMPTA